MDFSNLMFSDVYTWLIIPFLIFIARVTDVSLGTIRVIFISRGLKFLAASFGFFEILIWLAAIRQILLNLSSVSCYIAYAGGFAAGTFIGIYIEGRISIGNVIFRVITKKNSSKLLNDLKKTGYIVTSNGAEGPDGRVNIIFTIAKRSGVSKMVELIKKHDHQAIYLVEDIKFIDKKAIPYKRRFVNLFGFYRKEK